MEKSRKEMPLLLTGLALIWVLTGCGEKESAITPKARASATPTAQSPDRPADVAPPPPAAQNSAHSPAADDESPSPKGLSDVERLNWALQMYHIAHLSSPPLTSFEPLISAKLIREIPAPPPGKKFVLNGPGWEVRLEKAK